MNFINKSNASVLAAIVHLATGNFIGSIGKFPKLVKHVVKKTVASYIPFLR
jgi:hypothetical protein